MGETRHVLHCQYLSVRTGAAVFAFLAPALPVPLAEGFSRHLWQGEKRQVASLRPFGLPEAAVPNSMPAAASRPGSPDALGLRGAAAGLEPCEEPAERGHCFHHDAWAGCE